MQRSIKFYVFCTLMLVLTSNVFAQDNGNVTNKPTFLSMTKSAWRTHPLRIGLQRSMMWRQYIALENTVHEQSQVLVEQVVNSFNADGSTTYKIKLSMNDNIPSGGGAISVGSRSVNIMVGYSATELNESFFVNWVNEMKITPEINLF
jgi:hypothetical protein